MPAAKGSARTPLRPKFKLYLLWLYLLESEAKDRVGEHKKGISRNSSKATSRDTSRPPSAIENHIDYFREPVVKTKPEPTRVKSPEQLLMRSPDPINWTVPLDTGKTFQVTQSVRESGKDQEKISNTVAIDCEKCLHLFDVLQNVTVCRTHNSRYWTGFPF